MDGLEEAHPGLPASGDGEASAGNKSGLPSRSRQDRPRNWTLPILVVHLIVAFAIMTVTYWASLVFVQNGTDYLHWGLCNIVGVSIFTACQLAVFPRILPREKYGQFFAANQVIGISGLVVSPVLCGWVLETWKDYRLVYAWAGTFTLLGLGAAISLFRDWKQLGGDNGFDPDRFHAAKV